MILAIYMHTMGIFRGANEVKGEHAGFADWCCQRARFYSHICQSSLVYRIPITAKKWRATRILLLWVLAAKQKAEMRKIFFCGFRTASKSRAHVTFCALVTL